ncbi:hypothetical protein DY000_02014756 [Brassica cretica]|uniref:Uncharacterized protein n=1 Tax=Brassica cretica TaxID=69181 RepID=A0ABQ7CTU6_BRACR|nr:hypothetical protein DY000_02014756 [Brassica cretica]
MKRGKRRVSLNPTGEAPLQRIDFVSLSLPTENLFFSDEIHRKSGSTERYLLLLRLCGRVCAAGEAKLPSDHIAEGSHNKIHHTEEDSGCDECSTGSQRERQEDSLNSITSGKLLAFL